MYLPPGPELPWRGTYGSLPAATLKAPVEGIRSVPVEIVWSRDGQAPSYTVRFNAREQRTTPLTQIAAVYVSNLHSTVPTRLLFPDTGFEIEFPIGAEGFYPVITNGLEFLAYVPLTPAEGDAITIQVLNFLPPPLLNSNGAGGGGGVGVLRIDTLAPIEGGSITDVGTISLQTPLGVVYGGTGGADSDSALDGIAGVGGSAVGVMQRASDGTWSMVPLPSGSGPVLPLVVAQGGTGADTGNQALDNLSGAAGAGVLSRNGSGVWFLGPGGGTVSNITPGIGLTGGGSGPVVTLGLQWPVPVNLGGTGGTDAATARAGIGAAPLVSPAFSGNPTAPTPPPSDNDTSIATTAYVQNVLSGGLGGYLPLTGGTITGSVRFDDYNSPGASALDIFNDGQSHIEANTGLYINGNSAVNTIFGGGIEVQGDISGDHNLRVAGFIVQGGGYSYNTSYQGIASFSSSHNEIAVYGAGDAYGAPYTAIANDASNGILYVANGLNLRIQANGAGAIAFDTGATTTQRMIINTNGTVSVESGRLLSTGNNSPSISVINTAGGYYGMFSASQNFNLGAVDGTGAPTQIFAYWDAGGYLTTNDGIHVHHNRTAGLTLQTPGAGDTLAEYLNDNQKWDVGLHGGTDFRWITTPVGQASLECGRVTQFGAWGNLSGSWFTYSSADLKQDIEPYSRGLDAIKGLNPVSFRYRKGTPFTTADDPSPPQLGLIASEVAPYLPEIVGKAIASVQGEDREVDTLSHGQLVFALINAVKELSIEIEYLKAELKGKH